MIAWTRFKKLIKALLQIDCGSTRHVIEVITFAIPRERGSHRRSVASVEEIVWASKVLGVREARGCIAKVWCVVIKKRAVILSRSSTSKRDAHSKHRLYGRSFDSQQAHSPRSQSVRERCAGSGLSRYQLLPHRTGVCLKHRAPLLVERSRVKDSIGFKQFLSGHRGRNFQILRRRLPNVSNALSRDPTEKLVFQFAIEQFPGVPCLAFRKLCRPVIDQDCKWGFGFAHKAKKRTTLFEILRHVWDVDDRDYKLRVENRDLALSFILRDKLIDRFSMERVKRTFGNWLVIKCPKLFADIPGH